MGGLECSEIAVSDLEFSGRIDSEYYQKKFLEYEDMVCNHDSCPMGNLCHFLIGPFGSAYDTSNYVESPEYRYVRGQDVKPFFLQETSPRYMAKDDYLRLEKYALHKDDILISVVGTLANACIVQEKELPAIFSCKSTAVRIDTIDPYYLLAYLNSKYGRQLLLRKERGAIQKGLNLDDLKALEVPCFSDAFQKTVRRIVISAPVAMDNSSLLYRESQKLLMDSFHFDPTTVSTKNTTEKNLSESFGTFGRLDAEYYQSKYDDIALSLATRETVESLCKIYDKNYSPSDNADYQYIELANVGLNGEIYDVEVQHGKDLPTRARRKVKNGQVIIPSIEGSLQSCALISEEYDGALCSTGFYVIDSDRINSETLLVLFQSEPVQAMLRQRCSGTILTAISKEELQKMPLPFIDEDIQIKIAKKVQESFALRRQAERLIQTAVRAVEIAIAEGEAAADGYISAHR